MGKVKINDKEIQKDNSRSSIFDADYSFNLKDPRQDISERAPSGYPGDITAQSNIATVYPHSH